MFVYVLGIESGVSRVLSAHSTAELLPAAQLLGSHPAADKAMAPVFLIYRLTPRLFRTCAQDCMKKL